MVIALVAQFAFAVEITKVRPSAAARTPIVMQSGAQSVAGWDFSKPDEPESANFETVSKSMAPYRALVKQAAADQDWYVLPNEPHNRNRHHALIGDVAAALQTVSWASASAPVALTARVGSAKWPEERTAWSNWHLVFSDSGEVAGAFRGVQRIFYGGRGTWTTDYDTLVTYANGQPAAIYRSERSQAGPRSEWLVNLSYSKAGVLESAVVTELAHRQDTATSYSLGITQS